MDPSFKTPKVISKQEETHQGSCRPFGLSSPAAERSSVFPEGTHVAFVQLVESRVNTQKLLISPALQEKEKSLRVGV